MTNEWVFKVAPYLYWFYWPQLLIVCYTWQPANLVLKGWCCACHCQLNQVRVGSGAEPVLPPFHPTHQFCWPLNSIHNTVSPTNTCSCYAQHFYLSSSNLSCTSCWRSTICSLLKPNPLKEVLSMLQNFHLISNSWYPSHDDVVVTGNLSLIYIIQSLPMDFSLSNTPASL